MQDPFYGSTSSVFIQYSLLDVVKHVSTRGKQRSGGVIFMFTGATATSSVICIVSHKYQKAVLVFHFKIINLSFLLCVQGGCGAPL